MHFRNLLPAGCGNININKNPNIQTLANILKKMSDNIPFDIQIEIMQRLPVVSLVRFRSVSKQWKSLIENSEFINDHTRINRNRSQHHLLVWHGLNCEQYTSIIDNDTFPSQKSSLTVPPSISSLDSFSLSVLVNSVNGLSCFYGTCKYLGKLTDMAVLWNPIIRKYVGIAIPSFNEYILFGFGFCRDSSDPMLVCYKVNIYRNKSEVMVFTLSSRVWKSVSNVPPRGSFYLDLKNQVCIKGCIYSWPKDCSSGEDGETNNVIVSFDLESEKFGQVRLPECLLQTNFRRVAEVNESLAVLVAESDYNDKENIYVMWMMEFVTKSFTKMLTVKLPVPPLYGVFRVLGFRKNGEFIIEVDDGRKKKSRLEVYEPSSGRINRIWINGKSYEQRVNLYMETLLLLDQTSSIIP